MELYQLRTFITVAEERHLTRASRRLHLSQPTLTAHIKALEEELGLTLFIRTPKGMKLSREGELIEAQAKAALQAAETLLHRATELRNDLTGMIRIGLNISSDYLRITDLLAVVRQELPGLELHFSQKHSLEAMEEVRKDGLDVAFVFVSPDVPIFRAARLSTFGVAVVAPVQWGRSLRDFDIENLAEFPWIWPDNRCPFFRITQELFAPLGRLPEKAVIVESDATIRKLVASGVGLSLMVGPEALEASRNNELLILAEQVAVLELSVLCLEERVNDPRLRALLETVSRVWSHEVAV